MEQHGRPGGVAPAGSSSPTPVGGSFVFGVGDVVKPRPAAPTPAGSI